jgi:WD40 repeat protein
MPPMQKITFVLSLFTFLLLGARLSLFGETCAYQQQLILHVDDFAGPGSAGEFYSFDLTPDGERIIAKYSVEGDAKLSGVWIGVLQLQPRMVIKTVQLANGSMRAGQRDPQFRGSVGYTSDNRRIIVELGNSIEIFQASDLIHEGTISIDPETDLQGDIRSFSISGDGKRLALQIGDPTTVHLYDIESKKQLGEWKAAWNFRFALSQDGTYAAIPASVPSERGILPIGIVDAENGSPKAEIKSGFGYQDSWGSDAPVPLFLSDSLLLLTPSGGTDATGHHAGNSLKLFDWRTGRLLEEFPVPNSGTIGISGTSADGTQILTFSMPQSPFAVRADNAWWGHFAKAKSPEILFFQRGNAKSTCSISRISLTAGRTLNGEFSPRYDANFRHIGLFQGGDIAVWTRTQ